MQWKCVLLQYQQKQQAGIRLSYFHLHYIFIEYRHDVTDNFRCNDIGES